MIQTTARWLRGTVVALAVATLAIAAAPVSAKSANPKLVPADAAYVFSVPDVPAFWTAWKANSIYTTYKKVVANPEVATQMESFEKQLKTIETALGFPLDGNTLSQVLKSADVFVRAGESEDEVVVAFAFGVSDKEKLQKLLDLAEKAAIKAAAGDDESTATADAPAAKAVVEKHKDVEFRKVPGAYETPFYAQTGDLLLVTNNGAEMRALIDRVKGDGGGQVLAGNAEYERVEKALAAHPGEFYYVANPKAAYEMQGEIPGPMQGLQELVLKLQPDSIGGASIKINATDIEAFSYMPFKPGSTSPLQELFKKHPSSKSIGVMDFAPAKALVAMGTNLIDLPMFYEGLKTGLKESGLAGDANLDDQLKQMEEPLGFSVKNDLLPAFGDEMGLFLNSLKMPAGGAEMPEIDAAIIFSVKDKAKMAKVLSGLEKMLNAQLGALTAAMNDPSAGGQANAEAFKSEKAGNDTIKYVPLPMAPGLAPGFVLTDSHLLIGTSKDGLKKMLQAKAGEASLTASAEYKALLERVGAEAGVVQFANLSGIWDILLSVPDLESARPVIEALKVMKTAVSVQRSETDGAWAGKSVLVLN